MGKSQVEGGGNCIIRRAVWAVCKLVSPFLEKEVEKYIQYVQANISEQSADYEIVKSEKCTYLEFAREKEICLTTGVPL